MATLLSHCSASSAEEESNNNRRRTLEEEGEGKGSSGSGGTTALRWMRWQQGIYVAGWRLRRYQRETGVRARAGLLTTHGSGTVGGEIAEEQTADTVCVEGEGR